MLKAFFELEKKIPDIYSRILKTFPVYCIEERFLLKFVMNIEDLCR